MKRLYYFFKNYISDLITAIVGILGILIIWNQNVSIVIQQIISLIVIGLTLICIIYIRIRERDFIFSSLTSRKDKDSWLEYGEFEYNRTEKAYEIRNADPGYIHSALLTWSDYCFSFDFKIANWGGNDGGLGTIIRATNLVNYMMLQVKKSGIAPHIRINRNAWSI